MERNLSDAVGAAERVIRKYIEDDNVVFVFAQEVAASMWRERALDFHPRGVLPDERFMAWDRFKSAQAARAAPGLQEASPCLRALYAENLMGRNAAAALAGEPLLRAVVPAQFAARSPSFAKWIASILPYLAFWEEKRQKAKNGRGLSLKGKEADEERDLSLIYHDYKVFLKRHSLFEPSWLRRFEGAGKKHIIFFCETIENFSAYAPHLNPAPLNVEEDELPPAESLADFTAVSAPPFDGEEAAFRLCDDFREEFRQVALKIEEILLIQKESCDDIAVSLCDSEESEPYLMRELETRGIPVRKRFGHKLSESRVGRVFSLILQCKAEDFSFASVKRLLSLKSVAWREPEKAASLIHFGVENHCAVSWREGGKLKDCWEGAFRYCGKQAYPLKDWYLKLKRSVNALASAKTFADVRAAWFSFQRDFLDEEKMLKEQEGEEDYGEEGGGLLELASCIDELSALVQAEGDFPDIATKRPFAFFVSRLDSRLYVPQGKGGGVSIFKYKDAAAAPFKFHFITGASQEDATVLHKELDFLRDDKRKALSALDADASRALFSSYAAGGGSVFFSASKRGVGDYKTVHGAFAARAGKGVWGASLADPLEIEERQEKPPRIYPVQKAGFEAYSILNAGRGERFSFLEAAFEGSADDEAMLALRKRLGEKKGGLQGTRVSATDLSAFSKCPAKWFMREILGIDDEGVKFSPEIDLADSKGKGNIFHKVFEKLYKAIKEEDGAFRAAHKGRYLKKAEEIIRAEMEEALGADGMKNPLGASARPALEEELREGVEALASEDCRLLDGFIPDKPEKAVCFSEGGIEFSGRIDRISQSEDGSSTVIVDYKTGKTPKTSDYEPDGGEIKDFQMPFYVFLCRNALKMNVTQAWFFSVKEQRYVPILNVNDGKIAANAFNANTKRFECAEAFEDAIDAMKAEATAFADAVSAADFSAEGVYVDTCFECKYRAVCRHLYAVARD